VIFNSIDFLVFALVFFVLLPLTRQHRNVRYAFVTIASFIFYGWWDWRYLFLIIASGVIDFVAGYCIHRFRSRRNAFLSMSLLGNLGILFTFKYLEWVTRNLEQILSTLGMSVNLTSNLPPFTLVLPVGISFYTFQSMSYTIDIYRGNLKPTKNPLLFFSYLSMFPQLVAGPIVRAADIFEQLKSPARVDQNRLFEGAQLIARGFFKKVVIADTLAPFVTLTFGSDVAAHGSIYWWAATFAFGAQIYCDFSGYSDIAIGLTRWMGLDLKKNFNHPYIASSIREFWSRWHISLSTWFRDYVYIPLGGSRGSTARALTTMWITMLVSGLWHGAAWGFVVWGAIHAAFLSIERFFRKYRKETLMHTIAFTGLTQLVVAIAWVFFRSDSITKSTNIVATLFNPTQFRSEEILAIPKLVILCLLALIIRETYIFAKQKCGFSPQLVSHPLTQALIAAALLVFCMFYRGPGNAFIYFQF